MDDFVTTEILGCMDNQIILPTALRCALRSLQMRERRLKNFQTLRTFRKPLRIEAYGGSN